MKPRAKKKVRAAAVRVSGVDGGTPVPSAPHRAEQQRLPDDSDDHGEEDGEPPELQTPPTLGRERPASREEFEGLWSGYGFGRVKDGIWRRVWEISKGRDLQVESGRGPRLQESGQCRAGRRVQLCLHFRRHYREWWTEIRTVGFGSTFGMIINIRIVSFEEILGRPT